jgi:hypothetical protein
MPRDRLTPKPARPKRRPWVEPRIVRHGAVKNLVRGASGVLGDAGAGGVGKRQRSR